MSWHGNGPKVLTDDRLLLGKWTNEHRKSPERSANKHFKLNGTRKIPYIVMLPQSHEGILKVRCAKCSGAILIKCFFALLRQRSRGLRATCRQQELQVSAAGPCDSRPEKKSGVSPLFNVEGLGYDSWSREKMTWRSNLFFVTKLVLLGCFPGLPWCFRPSTLCSWPAQLCCCAVT